MLRHSHGDSDFSNLLRSDECRDADHRQTAAGNGGKSA